jgi:hypothetical protein
MFPEKEKFNVLNPGRPAFETVAVFGCILFPVRACKVLLRLLSFTWFEFFGMTRGGAVFISTIFVILRKLSLITESCSRAAETRCGGSRGLD